MTAVLLYYDTVNDGASEISIKSSLLLPEKAIKARLAALARLLHIYLDDHAILSPVRHGGMHIWNMIAPMIGHKVEVIPVKVASYNNMTRPTVPILEITDDYPACDRRIILMDDIVDTGGTQISLTEQLLERKAHEVIMVCLLDKPARRKYDVRPNHRGFVIPDLYVFGCGMDWQGQYRELPEIRYVIH